MGPYLQHKYHSVSKISVVVILRKRENGQIKYILDVCSPLLQTAWLSWRSVERSGTAELSGVFIIVVSIIIIAIIVIIITVIITPIINMISNSK